MPILGGVTSLPTTTTETSAWRWVGGMGGVRKSRNKNSERVDGSDEKVFVDTYTVALDRVCLTTLELSTLPRSVPVPYKPKKLSVALTSEGGMANGLRSKPETTRP